MLETTQLGDFLWQIKAEEGDQAPAKAPVSQLHPARLPVLSSRLCAWMWPPSRQGSSLLGLVAVLESKSSREKRGPCSLPGLL